MCIEPGVGLHVSHWSSRGGHDDSDQFRDESSNDDSPAAPPYDVNGTSSPISGTSPSTGTSPSGTSPAASGLTSPHAYGLMQVVMLNLMKFCSHKNFH